MKKLMAAVLAGLMLAGLLSGCANTANDDEVEYRWKMALNSTEGDNAYDTGVLFAQKIKELTDGRAELEKQKKQYAPSWAPRQRCWRACTQVWPM